ncbi:MAG TPA: response regulator transcription factor [Saprospiraceae bacterium]|nr:response regulator transcription factor [Saprospiraceae bacterium]
MRILLVEDEEQIRKLLKINLTLEGYEVVEAVNGLEAVHAIHTQHFDLILLDIMLPELNGFYICEQVRLRNDKVAIIFISAKDSSMDKIKGLKLGADDYITKPFVLEELLLRIQNLLKRSSDEKKSELDTYSFGTNHVNFDTFEASTVNGPVALTNKEALLLKMLVERKNEVVSRQQILQYVWGYDIYPTTRTIDNFILNFRKYFENDPKNPEYFHSIRGVGYKFTG